MGEFQGRGSVQRGAGYGQRSPQIRTRGAEHSWTGVTERPFLTLKYFANSGSLTFPSTVPAAAKANSEGLHWEATEEKLTKKLVVLSRRCQTTGTPVAHWLSCPGSVPVLLMYPLHRWGHFKWRADAFQRPIQRQQSNHSSMFALLLPKSSSCC